MTGSPVTKRSIVCTEEGGKESSMIPDIAILGGGWETRAWGE
jgi:hypothetical protein